MIQRIQSFWLVLAACCMAMCFLFPVAQYSMTMSNTGQMVEARLDLVGKDNPAMMEQLASGAPSVGYSQPMSGFKTWPLIVLAVLAGVLALVSVFLYANRMKQMRMVAVAFLVSVIYVFLIFIWAVEAYGKVVATSMGAGAAEVKWAAGAFLPIAAVILLILALRGIRRDEAKVRAADRLR